MIGRMCAFQRAEHRAWCTLQWWESGRVPDTTKGDPMNREQWLVGLASRMTNGESVAVLPSYPAQRARSGRVADIGRDEDGRTVLLVSPLLAESAEVAVVLAYLIDRVRIVGTGRLTDRRAGFLRSRGWFVDGWTVNPTDERARQVFDLVDDYVAEVGEYPAEAIQSGRRRQTGSRMRLVSCTIHDDVRVRLSSSQIESGAPLCGRDHPNGSPGAVCSLRLTEVA